MNPEQNGGQQPPQYQNQPVPGAQPPPQSVSPQQSPQTSMPPAPGTPGHNPYEFIMNPGKPPKKPIALAGNSMLQRILIAGGGLVVLIIAGLLVMSLLTSGSKETTTIYLDIVQEQTELIRVATAASSSVTSLQAQNLAQNVQATVTSQNAQLLTYLKGNGQKFAPAQLTLKHSKTTDATLLAAQENNTYDNAFKDIIQADLETYTVALQKAYKLNPGPNGKKLLASQYDGAVLLKTASKQ